MNVDITHSILAIVTGKDAHVEPGAAPVFRVADQAERERIAKYIGTVTLGTVHDLRDGTFIVVKH